MCGDAAVIFAPCLRAESEIFMNGPRLDHIGIAVEDILTAVRLYELLGFSVKAVEDVPSFGVKVAFLPMSSGSVELVQPVDEGSAMARFIEKHGPGIHHLSFEVDDIRSEMARLQAAGMRLADTEPRAGAHGTMVVFLHPKSTGGVLIELVEKVGDGG